MRIVDILGRDVPHAIRGLLKAPVFTVVSMVTLGLGVGVITAAFAVIDAVILRPITHEQEQVARISHTVPERDDFRDPYSFPEFQYVRDHTRTLSGVAAIQYHDAGFAVLTIDDEPTALRLAQVSAEFLPLLTKAAPLAGRFLTAADEARGADLAIVIGERFWRRVTGGGDPAFVGRRFRLDGGRTVVVVGVAPDEFDYPVGTDAWVPISSYFSGAPGHFDAANAGFAHFELVGRLAAGVGPAEVRNELQRLSRQFASLHADVEPEDVRVQPVLDLVLGGSPRTWWFLLSAAALVLAIGGVNVAALLLMRETGRRRESAVRLALGATRVRLALNAVIESGIIAAGAVAIGLTVASLLLWGFGRLGSSGVPRIEHASIDERVLLLGFLAALLWTLTLGLAPLWLQRRLAPKHAGDLSSRGGTGFAGLRLFTVIQITAAVIVTVGGTLLVRSFMRLEAIERGFDPANLAIIPVLPPEDRFPDRPARLDLFDRLTTRLEAVPGVIAATPVHMGPGTGYAGLSATMLFQGQTPEDAESNPWATFDPVTPTYFRTFGIPIVEGRAFTDADGTGKTRAAIVSESVARRYWPGERAVGKSLRFEAGDDPIEVVGVAGEVRYRELTRTWLTVYFPAGEFFWFKPGAIVVRTHTAPEPMMPSLRAAIRAEEPSLPVLDIAGMPEALASETSRQRTALAIVVFFAVTATILSAVGAYSVLSYEVSQRRRELAVRSALGASPARLFGAVVRQSALLAVLGVVMGLSMAALATRALESLLFEVERTDAASFAFSAGMILIVTLAGAVLPGRRAAGTDPVGCLRSE